jgi:hypothetical protein
MHDPIKASAQATLDYIDQKIEELIAARLTLIRTFGLNDPQDANPAPSTAKSTKCPQCDGIFSYTSQVMPAVCPTCEDYNEMQDEESRPRVRPKPEALVAARETPQESPVAAPEAKPDPNLYQEAPKPPAPTSAKRTGFNPFPAGPRPPLGLLPTAGRKQPEERLPPPVVKTRAGSHQSHRRSRVESQHILLKAIKENGPMTGLRLAKVTGINQPGIYAMLDHEWFDKEPDGYHISSAGNTELQSMIGGGE